MKPFDIQKANEGHPLCTRDGSKVLYFVDTKLNIEYPCIALIEGNIVIQLARNGKCYPNDHPLDLFLATVKKTWYAAMVRVTNGHHIYSAPDKARFKELYPDIEVMADHVFEWEE